MPQVSNLKSQTSNLNSDKVGVNSDKIGTKSSKKATSMRELMDRAGSVMSLKKGDQVEGVVKKLTPREILLDIGYKSDALVIEFDKENLENLLSFLKVGDKVTASVISAESEEGFPVLSLRRTLDDLIFSKFENLYKKQDTVEVKVTDVTKGGYFAQAQGIKGFVPNSQMLEEAEVVGKNIKVKVIEFDKARRRIIFSQKATLYTTDATQIQKYIKKGDQVEARVTNVSPYGLYTAIEPKEGIIIEGFIHISEISYQRVSNLGELFKKGDVIKGQVIDFDKESKRVNLSIKKLEKDTFVDIESKYKKDQKVKGRIVEVRNRGVTIEIEPNIFGFIQSSKIPTGATYNVGDTIDAEINDLDKNKRLIMLTPILKEIPVGYR